MTQTETRKSRRESSNEANRKRRLEESTVFIPKLTPTQRRKRAKLEQDNEAWIWEMCGPKSGIFEPLTRKFTSQQCVMIGTYKEILEYGGDDLILASRGEGKTTYLRSMVWKSVAEGSVDFAAFISATGNDANNSANAIKSMTVKSEPFAKLYPEIALPCRRARTVSQLAKSMRATGVQFDNGRKKFTQHPIEFSWSTEISMPDVPGSPSAGAIMRFCGADSPIRGLNIDGRRPKIVIMDDLDNQNTVNNPDVAQKVIDEVDTSIGGLGTPTSPVARIMLATLPKQGVGVAHHYANRGYPFVVRRFRYLEEKPDRWDLWMQYVTMRQRGKIAGDKYGRKAHKFYIENRQEMDAGAKVSNDWRFNNKKLPDGSQAQLSSLQNYFDEWADKGEMFCRCELDNEIIEAATRIESSLEMGHVSGCEGEYDRGAVDPTTTMIVRGIDVRKIELHWSTMAEDQFSPHRVIDYDVRSHATTEITVEQSETAIFDGLNKLADEWHNERHVDINGGAHTCDLTLIDKGWKGSWTEDGERKSWASQPVERFCMERGLRRWLPAKGQPNYKSPAESQDCIVGDHWHMNRGAGSERACTEVIWDAEYWHSLVEGLFMLPDEDDERFILPIAGDGVHTNHKRLSEHIYEGAQELAELRRRASRTRKPKFRRDHWWDSFAMMLVARSIEIWFRENLASKRITRSGQPVRSDRKPEPLEIGAR